MSESKNTKGLRESIELNISKLSSFDEGSDERKKVSQELEREIKSYEVLVKLDAIEEQSKANEKKFNEELDLKKKELELKQLELDSKVKALTAETTLKELELAKKDKQFKVQLIVTSATAIVSPLLIFIGNQINSARANKLALRALTMEYIDNGIAPRSYSECLKDIKSFIKK